jgi:hypothetical protein
VALRPLTYSYRALTDRSVEALVLFSGLDGCELPRRYPFSGQLGEWKILEEANKTSSRFQRASTGAELMARERRKKLTAAAQCKVAGDLLEDEPASPVEPPSPAPTPPPSPTPTPNPNPETPPEPREPEPHPPAPNPDPIRISPPGTPPPGPGEPTAPLPTTAPILPSPPS